MPQTRLDEPVEYAALMQHREKVDRLDLTPQGRGDFYAGLDY